MRRDFTRASCRLCRREVWAWDDGTGRGIVLFDVEYYDGRMHLISHPCWCDDEDDVRSYPLPPGSLS